MKIVLPQWPQRRRSSWRIVAVVLVFIVLIAFVVFFRRPSPAPTASAIATTPKTAAVAAATPSARPTLSVTAATPQTRDWPRLLSANGNIAPWQEAVIGAEIGNVRIIELRGQVGDQVKKGAILARFDSEAAAAAVREAHASLEELDANAREAMGNAKRADDLRRQGYYSAQMHTQYQTAKDAALARREAAAARLANAELRQQDTVLRAPDNGVISARSGAVGSLTQQGQELFRLIRDGRIEWRAEVTANDLPSLRRGVAASVVAPDGARIAGRVRAVSPGADPQTRMGLVYVDLPRPGPLRAGMYARGEFQFGQLRALTLPAVAVIQRDGLPAVLRLEEEGAQSRVALTKISTGRRIGDEIEITGGITATTRVVANGAGLLNDGDWVRVVGNGE